ncbi:MAG: TonB-dependent receptor [bacterium]
MKSLLIFLLFCATIVTAQKLRGVVYEAIDGNNLPLPGVNIFWAETSIGTATDSEGKFEIIKTSADSARLVISYVSYKPDTLWIKKSEESVEITLQQNKELNEIIVAARMKGTLIKELDAIFKQELTIHELKKAACCNLSESFETNASVDVSYGDAVTGAKQIKLLGLAGKYSQLMTENIPNLRGLASAFGIYYIPGPWMESIQISKGTASVINGFESTTGQVNVEFKKHASSPKFYADVFSSDNLKNDVNAISSVRINEGLTSTLFLHGEYFGKNIDHNHDSFLDHPNVRQLNILNKWNFEDFENWHIAASINYLIEERYGGQIGFGNANSSQVYRNIIETNRFQFWSKVGYMFSNEQNTSIGFINMITTHKQNSVFGVRNYDADEVSYYSNLIFESEIFNKAHKINTGLSFIYDKRSEHFSEIISDKNEIIPGAFFQYTFQPVANLTLIGGIRGDIHSEFGTFITPRFHVRYSPFANTSIRLTAGKGFHSASIIAENISLLSTSRQFIAAENIEMEEAFNYGINLTQYVYLFDREMTINTEYYRTEFENKVVVDIDQSSHEVHFYNLDGKSFSNNFQIEINYEMLPQLDVLGAIRFTDSKTTYHGKLLSDPLEKKFKGLVSVSYQTPLRLWQFDFTAQFNGPSRIPNFQDNHAIHLEAESPAYTNILAQITHYLKDWEIFVGVENLTNFTQHNPVISADDPFGSDYDASIIWGPVEGRKFYLGLRFSIK